MVVHRLDRGTSGLLVFAKNPRIASELRDQFRVRKAEREYAVLVAGTLEQQQGTFTTRLATTKGLQRYSLGPGQKGGDQEGERAVTHFRVQQRLQGATWVTASLETGKRNQIRVHFAEAGHPVLGDERYRADLAHHPAWTAKRLALHAAVLGFRASPVTPMAPFRVAFTARIRTIPHPDANPWLVHLFTALGKVQLSK